MPESCSATGDRMWWSEVEEKRVKDQTGANTTSANANSAHLTVFANVANRLQIRIPEAFCLVVGVAHIVADVGGFPAELTFPAHGKASFLFEIG